MKSRTQSEPAITGVFHADSLVFAKSPWNDSFQSQRQLLDQASNSHSETVGLRNGANGRKRVGDARVRIEDQFPEKLLAISQE